MSILKKKRIPQIITLIFALVFVAVLLHLSTVPPSVKVETVEITRGTFINIVNSDGILRARERYTVVAISDGDIRRVSLRVGDEVKRGESVAELIRDVNYFPVPSPITGVVSKVYRESAGPIRRGEPLVEIIDPLNLEIVTELLTTDATQIKIGDSIVGTGWGGEGEVRGRVKRISQAGFIKNSALGVEEEKTEVIGDISETPLEIKKKLGSNYHLDVAIEFQRFHDALKVPVGALFRSGRKWAVFRIKNRRAIETQVLIKAKGNQDALVESGINEGDIVIIYPGDLIEDGAKIQE
jgi:HlyD family secretion protein